MNASDELQIKLNRIITKLMRAEEEIDGIKGDLVRLQRFEKLNESDKYIVDEAHKLSCSAEAYLEEARIYLSK